MRTLNYAMAIAILALLSSLGSAQGPADGPKPSEPPRTEPIFFTAERDITVLYQPDFAVSHESLDTITASKHLAEEAIAELTGMRHSLESTHDGGHLRGTGYNWIQGWLPEKSRKEYKAYFAYLESRHNLIAGAPHNNLHSLRLKVAIGGKSAQADVEKYANLVVKHLNRILADLSRRAFDRKLAELKLAAQEARNAEQLADEAWDASRARVRAQSSGLSIIVLQELASDLKKTHQALEVELAGMKGRAEALRKEVAKTADRVDSKPAEDDVMRNLQRVIDLRTKQLKTQQQLHEMGSGGATYLNVAKAEEQVALAEVELAQHRQSNRRSASERLEKLNDDLAQIATNIAENEAKLEHVRNRLEEYSDLLDRETEAQPLREKLAADTTNLVSLRSATEKAMAKVKHLEATFKPTRVEIFELKSSDEKPAHAENSDKR